MIDIIVSLVMAVAAVRAANTLRRHRALFQEFGAEVVSMRTVCRRSVSILVLMLAAVAGGASASDEDPVVQPPQYLAPPVIEYPKVSRRLGEQGKVLIRLFLSSDGVMKTHFVLVSSGFPRLDAAAMKTVTTIRLSPGKTRSGKAVGGWIDIPMVFEIERPAPVPPPAADPDPLPLGSGSIGGDGHSGHEA